MATLTHPSLNATLTPLARGPLVTQFRGLKYARIHARFARAKRIDDWGGAGVDCRAYGPRCPQNKYDVGHLLRLPEEFGPPGDEEEDEFECLNLDVTVPSGCGGEGEKALPVLIWIHGGSQVMTFASAKSGVCDTARMVADSVQQDKPMVVVSVAYRLNIFAFGDGKGETNLALKDQRTAIEWVRMHIAGFRGDPSRITLAGESAGAVYVHAHIVTKAPVSQAILASGSLGLSPPQAAKKGEDTIAALRRRLGGRELGEVSVEELLKAQAETGLHSLWLQMEPGLDGWEDETGSVEGLLLGDVEYESVLWRNGVESMTAEQIEEAFAGAGQDAAELRRLYRISAARPTQSKLGALDFIHDVRFTLPIRRARRLWRCCGKRVYAYVCDQTNPWQASSRAHHAVDLLFLFGGFDLSFDPGAEAVGAAMRRKWICFAHGEEPWSAAACFAFGPLGDCREVDDAAVAARRRAAHARCLEAVDAAKVNAAFAALAAGRLSLLN